VLGDFFIDPLLQHYGDDSLFGAGGQAGRVHWLDGEQFCS
jgi:hypothetical protein